MARQSGAQLKVVEGAPRRGPAAERKRLSDASGVVAQVKVALRPRARLATALGFLLGGFVPLATFEVAHREIGADPLYSQLASYLVLGGLFFSMATVYAWGKLAFKVPVKALGFVVLLEGVMVTSHIGWLSVAALAYLVCINGIATGCTLAKG
jgi:hypothetical protein